MGTMNDIFGGLVDGALKEVMRKSRTTRRTTRRKKRATGITGIIANELEKLIAPAKKQKSRRRTAKARSKTTRRKVATRTTRRRASTRSGGRR